MLHRDTITADINEKTKVRFIQYEGIAPKRYLQLFDNRAGDKKKLEEDVRNSIVRDPLLIDDYYDLEHKIIIAAQDVGLVN